MTTHKYKCPHCGKPINPGQMLGQTMTDKKRASLVDNRRNAGKKPRRYKAKATGPSGKSHHKTGTTHELNEYLVELGAIQKRARVTGPSAFKPRAGWTLEVSEK
jgi:hypothetical protein